MTGAGTFVAAPLAAAACLWLVLNPGPAQVWGQAQPPATDGRSSFDRVATVLQSPRCLNCHPSGDRPSQGDDRHIHQMNVMRGAADSGVPAMRCRTCHQDRNNDSAGIPGAPRWRLAPASMGWVGLSAAELCRALVDPQRNGGRSIGDLVDHMTGDNLVLWAWNPGRNRTAPPVSTNELKGALEQWARAGAPCPD